MITPDTFNYPYAFVVLDKNGCYVADIYCVRFDEDGSACLTELGNDSKEVSAPWGNRNLNRCKKVKFEGMDFVIEDYRDVIESKHDHIRRHGGELGEKHQIDIETAKLIEAKVK